ncbi:hypothetical protein SLEP1_g3816 [Rubroshorea leprosula]|uniref:Uncharacterized protein n=1 Tax=Rubroshorea leprosula TaxID=152421 RepID=A0AAV5HSG9_9ROSI|nr:hypothetical protein SLEP1_g3816 [Rubroshorea leprosula]
MRVSGGGTKPVLCKMGGLNASTCRHVPDRTGSFL